MSDDPYERGADRLRRFVRERDEADLDAAVADFEAAVLGTAPDDPEWPIVVGALARALRIRFHVRPANEADRAIELLEDLLGRGDLDDEIRASVLEDLASTLHARHAVTRQAADVTDRIAALRAALECTRDAARTYRLRNRLALTLYDSHRAGGSADQLDDAIEVFEVALEQGAPDEEALMTLASNLGAALEVRFEHRGADADLARAIDVYRHGLELGDVADGPRIGLTNNMAGALKKRYLHGGDPDDLDDAISLYEDSAGLAAQSPHLPAIQGNLAGALDHRYQRSGDRRDLDRARQLLEQSLAAADSDGERADRLGNLGNILTSLYTATGELTFAHEAERRHAEAVELVPRGSRERPRALSNLAGALRLIFGRTGDDSILARSIELHQRAVDAVDPDAPDAAAMQSNLAVALRERYELDGDASDLDRAIELLVTGVDSEERRSSSRLDASPRLAELWGNLATGLAERAARDNRSADLDRAIDLFASAAAAFPTDSPRRTLHLVNQALAMQDRSRRNGGSADLDDALEVIEATLEATDSSAARATLLNLRGNGLLDRFERDQRPADLDDAVTSYRQATMLPAGDGDRARFLSNLSQALRTYDDQVADSDVRAEAIEAARNACIAAEDAAPAVTLACGREWGEWAIRRKAWSEASEALGYAAEASWRGFKSQTLRRQKEAWLLNARGVNTSLAYARARHGDLEGAVVAAEDGRALLLGEALDLDRRALDSVVGTAPRDVVDRYRRAALHYRDLQRRGMSSRLDEPDRELSPQSLREARRSLEDAIVELRHVPGLDSFLAPTRVRDVVPQIGRSLVYVIAAAPGGVALIVSDDGSIGLQLLPQLTEPAVNTRVRRLSDMAETDPAWPAALDDVTSWLWGAAMGPVVDGVAGSPEVIVVATGTLGVLPLHAAWETSDTRPTGRRYALDELAIAYAPSARTIGVGPGRSGRDTGGSLAAVVDPPSTGQPPLDYAKHELDTAQRAFASTTILPGAKGTADEVAALLARNADVVHFGCHAQSSALSPLENCLLLTDVDRLTVDDLLAGPRISSRLAVLSACETAHAGLTLPDEMVGLPTGFLEAGCAGVVASMWKVVDDSTALVMLRFYHEWTRSSASLAVALSAAQGWVRDSTNSDKVAWLRDTAVANRDAGLPYAGLNTLYQDIGLQDPDSRDHSGLDHWAAFACFGT